GKIFCFKKSGIIFTTIINLIIIQNVTALQKYWVPLNPPEANYKIEVNIDVDNSIVEGSETVKFVNTYSKEISIIAMDWCISRVSFLEVEIKGKSIFPLNYKKNKTVSSPLFYVLPEPVFPGKELILKIKFSRYDLIGNNKEEILLQKWFPRLWWNDLPVYDRFRVKLDIPDGYSVAISGILNKETGYYENNGINRFGIYLGKGLNVETREVTGIQVTSLFTEKGKKCALLCLETAVDAIKFYKSWLGFYPFKFLYIIPGASRPVGGYPFASGIVVIHGQEQFDKKSLLHWKWITAHEIGHQYWGEYVMDVDYSSWLWIGMGIYADREYILFRNLGLDKHKGLMNRYLDGLKKKVDTTVDLPYEQLLSIKFDRNNIVVHGKGFSIISALECVLGKETFERIYKKCLKDYGRKRLGYNDFWNVCEQVSGQNLNWFFEQWVRSNKYLCYQIVSRDCIKDNDKYISYIKVERKGSMVMPVPVKVIFEDSTSQVKYTNTPLKVNTLKFESKSKLVKAILDPYNKLAMLKNPLPITYDELIRNISRLPWSGAGEDAFETFKEALDLNLDRYYLWFKLGLTLFDGGYYKESFESFKKVVECNPSRFYHFATLVWLGHLRDLEGKRKEALKYYNEALKYDEGKTMTHSQFGMVINREWVEKRLKMPFVLGERKK
ncbi:hypothetical protein DRQ09_01615, partial [candidate division KSB1 bacterium]